MKYILDKINEVKERVFESVMQKKKRTIVSKEKNHEIVITNGGKNL